LVRLRTWYPSRPSAARLALPIPGEYPQFILATAVTKGAEGFLIGLIGYGERARIWRKWAGALAGAIVIVVGYFVFEAFVYPALGRTVPFFNVTTLEAALVEAPINLIQGIVGAVVGVGLWKAVAGFKPRSQGETVES